MSRANDLARLREETQTGHHERVEFVTGITRRVTELRKANQAGNKKRRHNVLDTLAANEARRKREANDQHKERIVFVADLGRTVAKLRKENQAQNTAAHAAWCGPAQSVKRGKNWVSQAE